MATAAHDCAAHGFNTVSTRKHKGAESTRPCCQWQLQLIRLCSTCCQHRIKEGTRLRVPCRLISRGRRLPLCLQLLLRHLRRQRHSLRLGQGKGLGGGQHGGAHAAVACMHHLSPTLLHCSVGVGARPAHAQAMCSCVQARLRALQLR